VEAQGERIRRFRQLGFGDGFKRSCADQAAAVCGQRQLGVGADLRRSLRGSRGGTPAVRSSSGFCSRENRATLRGPARICAPMNAPIGLPETNRQDDVSATRCVVEWAAVDAPRRAIARGRRAAARRSSQRSGWLLIGEREGQAAGMGEAGIGLRRRRPCIRHDHASARVQALIARMGRILDGLAARASAQASSVASIGPARRSCR
jgi:hypothetical protein